MSERACPRCGSTALVPVIYGYPDPQLFEREERGEVLLGGCVIQPDAPAVVCRRCGANVISLEGTERATATDLPPP